jgi:hypothetical protein
MPELYNLTQVTTADTAHDAVLAGDMALAAGLVLAHPASLLIDNLSVDHLLAVKQHGATSPDEVRLLRLAIGLVRRAEQRVGGVL